MHNRKTNLAKVGLGDQVSPPPPPTPQLFTVDLADSRLQNGPTRISENLTVSWWFLLPSGRQIISHIYRFCDNSLFCLHHQLLFYPNSHGTASVLFEVFLMEYSTSVKEASTKVIVSKMVTISVYDNKSFGCQDEEWITVELQNPFCVRAVVKMREAVFAFAKIQLHLCYLQQLHQSKIH